LIAVPFVWFIALYGVIAHRYGIFSSTFWEKLIGDILYFGMSWYFGIPLLGLISIKYICLVIGTILFHLQHSVNQPYRVHKENWDPAKAAV
jgi:hypothetical protein